MTAPVEMKHPRINRSAFQEALDKVKINADGLEIQTRSELQLIEAEKDLILLVNEGREIRNELEYVENFLAELNKIHKTLQVNEADNATARRALLAQINVFRESGIEIPKEQ